jgi:hypothetical protein
MATGAPMYHSRPGLRLWRCLCPTVSGDGHSGSANCTTVTMAERMCRAPHRIDPAGLPRPCHRVWRAASSFCSNHTKNITTRHARTYHWRRTRRSPAPSKPPVKGWPCQFWAVCTTNISGCEFTTGTPAASRDWGPSLDVRHALAAKGSPADCGPWHPGQADRSRLALAKCQCRATNSITSSCSVKRTCAGSWTLCFLLSTIMSRGPIDL